MIFKLEKESLPEKKRFQILMIVILFCSVKLLDGRIDKRIQSRKFLMSYCGIKEVRILRCAILVAKNIIRMNIVDVKMVY